MEQLPSAAIAAMAAKARRVPARPPFDRIALLLQGGGALGSYQAGVYAALAQAELEPDWVAGISIGAINGALIAGNAPERRVEQLRTFCEHITEAPFGPDAWFAPQSETSDIMRGWINQTSAAKLKSATVRHPRNDRSACLDANSRHHPNLHGRNHTCPTQFAFRHLRLANDQSPSFHGLRSDSPALSRVSVASILIGPFFAAALVIIYARSSPPNDVDP